MLLDMNCQAQAPLAHEELGLAKKEPYSRDAWNNLIPDPKGYPWLVGHACIAPGPIGDYYSCIPRHCILRILDRNGRPAANALIKVWQDVNGIYSGKPKLKGKTNSHGLWQLPNRRARRSNPFGEISSSGSGDVFFMQISARGETDFAWLDINDLNQAFWSGQKNRAVFVRRTNIPSYNAIAKPADLTAKLDGNHVLLRWKPVSKALSYRVYSADGDVGIFCTPIAKTQSAEWRGLAPEAHMTRYAVTAIGRYGKESAMSASVRFIRFQQPWGIAIRPDGRILIRDAGFSRTALLDSNGQAIGLMGSRNYHFEGSFDIALDPHGRILCAKRGNEDNPNSGFTIQSPDFQIIRSYRVSEGSDPGHFNKPMGICSDSHGNIFIADTENNRVQEFTPQGKFLQIIGADELRLPMKVAADTHNHLYVVDFGSNKIYQYTLQTDGSWKMKNKLSGVKEPVSAAIDSRGRIFASSHRFAAVHMFSTEGKDVWQWKGNVKDMLSGPRGIAFNGKGFFYVVDEALRDVIKVKMP
jgi:streptogramin lyase